MATATTLHGFEQLVDDYNRGGRRRGHSPNTERGYGWAYERMRRFMAERHLELEDLRPEHVEAFQDDLIAAELAESSRRIASTALRNIFQWAQVRSLPVHPDLWLAVERVHVKRGLPRPIPAEDLRRLLAYLLPRRPRASEIDLRDRALFLYLLGSSARVSEVLQLTRHDFERPVVRQKGGSEKVLAAPPVVLVALQDYLGARKDACPWLWVTYTSNREQGRLMPEGVNVIWPRLARKVGVTTFNTHMIRHSSASLLLEADINPAIIAEHLGHRDLSTVMNYAKGSTRRRQQAVDALEAAIARPGTDRPTNGRHSGPSGADGMARVEAALGRIEILLERFLAQGEARP